MSHAAVKGEKQEVEPGWVAAEFSLRGTDDRIYTLKEARGPKGLIVIFMCNHCPYVRGALGRIITDMQDLKGLGYGVIGVMSNDTENYPDDNFENMKKLAAAESLPFPYVIDETQEVAEAYDAVSTPEFYGFDVDLKLVYHGRLDAAGRGALPPGGKRELFEAMKAVADGGSAPANQQPSIGCTIKWKR